MDSTYNGWTNYATWLVVVHLQNTYSLYHWYRKRVEKIKNSVSSEYQVAAFAADLKKLVYSIGKNSPMKKDLANSDWNINYEEIAEELLHEDD